MAVITCFQFGSARSAPGEIFTISAPVLGSDPPKSKELGAGDSSVSTQTGALTYSYPIAVPPGRNGMAPKLALSYSSQAPIYGGIASGWSLSIPAIQEDTSRGRLRTHSPQVENLQSDPRADDEFVSGLAGGRPLVKVPWNASDPPIGTGAAVYATYRAQADASYARYERMNAGQGYFWRVKTLDGNTMYFGELDKTPGCTHISEANAPLTRVVDPFGNEVEYTYEPGEEEAADECRPAMVKWGKNAAASIGWFASLELTYTIHTSCGGLPVGSQLDYRTGVPILTGASRLVSLTAKAFPHTLTPPGVATHTRLITLAYEGKTESCSMTDPSPYRQLFSIQESAWGTDAPRVDLPSVQFTYGSAKYDLETAAPGTSAPWMDGIPGNAQTLAWGYRFNDDRWPTVEAMFLDVDGDGLLDRVRNSSTAQTCKATWYRNKGPNPTDPHGSPQFGTVLEGVTPTPGEGGFITLPRLKWHRTNDNDFAGSPSADLENEGCALNAMWTRYRNAGVIADNQCNDGGTCAATSSNPNILYCEDGRECRDDSDYIDDFETYVAYRWMDVNADGLVDLVAAVHGNIRYYDIESGNGFAVGHGEQVEPVPLGASAWPACPEIDRCRDLSESCIGAAISCPNKAPCTTDWSAVNACIAAAPELGCAEMTSDHTQFDGVSKAPPQGGGSLPQAKRAYSRCEGLYPWFIYQNQGNGNLAAPEIKYMPVPLESNTGDSSLAGRGLTSQHHGVMDFDGDSVPDVFVRDNGSASFPTGGPYWEVWRGDGTGGVHPKMYVFPGRPGDRNYINGINLLAGPGVQNAMGLADMNGDGLQDHWLVRDGDTMANVAMHVGTHFALFGATGEEPSGGENTLSGTRPANDTRITVQDWGPGGPGVNPLEGYTRALLRTIDLDADGRFDLAAVSATNVVTWHPNVGLRFRALAATYTDGAAGITRWTKARPYIVSGLPTRDSWELWSDLVDLDGDSLPEQICFAHEYDSVTHAAVPCGGSMRRYHSVADGPPRLLKEIHNGRGLTTSVQYAQMHDRGTVVTQDPQQNWPGAGPPLRKATSSTQWVVASVTVSDMVSATNTTTSYQYVNPRHAPDDRGLYGFRGFEKVMKTAQSGARTEEVFDYSVDWSGRVSKTTVYPGVGPKVHSVVNTTYVPSLLFGGLITTYHTSLNESLTCTEAQTVCSSADAAGYVRTEAVQSTYASALAGGVPLVNVDTQSTVMASAVAADGNRRTTQSFVLDATPTTYRLRPTGSLAEERVAGSFLTFGRTEKTWDPSNRVPVTEERWVDSNAANRLISRTVFDMNTGNVSEVWKPKQNNAGTTRSHVTYDANKLFVASETNELGHVMEFTYDYGTGSPLRRIGPNSRGCNQLNCPNGADYPAKQETRAQVDGLGRAIAEWVTLDDTIGGHSYRLWQRQSIAYDDTPDGTPISVTKQTRLDTATSVWTMERTNLDGHGRPVMVTVSVQGTAPADQVTTYSYDHDGTLKTVQVPNPQANNAGRVTYTYDFDSLGRPTTLLRPYGSRIDMSYDGLNTTTAEFSSLPGAVLSQTKTSADRLGRVTQVHELASAAPTWATTTYTFGPRDEITRVVDPEGVTTDLTFDWAARRTQVSRHGKVWKYVYDRNGNIVSEQVPGSSGPLDDVNYITTVAFDDLDRATSRVIGGRALSVGDRSLFGVGTEQYVYDAGTISSRNMIGQLGAWKSFAPGDVNPRVQANYAMSARSEVTTTEQILAIDGMAPLTRRVSQDYYLFGGEKKTQYRDAVGVSSEETSSVQNYDARGLPSSIVLTRGASSLTIATQTRNVAGLVIARSSPRSSGGTAIAQFVYDQLGRVSQNAASAGSSTVGFQHVFYSDHDDVQSMNLTLGSTTRSFTYSYDTRHQLTGVSVATPGYFTAAYTYGDAGRLSTANESRTILPLPAGAELMPRNVNYSYGGSDPEQVTALNNASAPGQFSTYTYDAAGNQTARCYGGDVATCPGEKTTYTYDGNDRLRRASRTVGTSPGSEEYWYDHSGTRIAVLKRNTGGARTGLVWFIGPVEATYSAAGVVTSVSSYISAGTPVARVERTGPTATTLEYRFHGIASSILATIPYAASSSSSAFAFTPGGRLLEVHGPALASNRRRLNDKYVDSLSGLGYYGARYYDNVLLGWTQTDPLYEKMPDSAGPRRANLYTFSLQNPNRYVDPDGLDSRSVSSQHWIDSFQSWYLGNMNAGSGYVGSGCQWFRAACPRNVSGAGTGTGVRDGTGIQYTWGEAFDPVIEAMDVIAPEMSEAMEKAEKGDVTALNTLQVAQGKIALSVVSSAPGIFLRAAATAAAASATAGSAAKALPAARQIEAVWGGANAYKDGSIMSSIQHIMYRHASTSTFAKPVSQYLAGTTVRTVRALVDEALRYGTVTQKGGVSMIEHTFGRAIGTAMNGAPATSIRVYVNSSKIIRTAYPF